MSGRHVWPDRIVDVVELPPDPVLGDFAVVTERATRCGNCGLSRAEALGRLCVPDRAIVPAQSSYRVPPARPCWSCRSETGVHLDTCDAAP